MTTDPVYENFATTGAELYWPIAGLDDDLVDANVDSLTLNVRSYGAVADGLTDDTTAFQRAVNAASAAGGGVVLVPAGRYSIASDLTPAANVVLRGVGCNATILHVPTGVSTRNRIFYYVGSTVIENFGIEHIGFEGRWDDYTSELSENGLVTLNNVRNLDIQRCAFKKSRYFSLNINECDHVNIHFNLFEESVRDMIAVWGTPNAKITSNFLAHNDDDGISINYETEGSDPIRSNIVVSGNILVDTGPIRAQVPIHLNVHDNLISRPRGQGVNITTLNFSTNELQAGHGVSVHHNQIYDVIDRQWFVDGTQTGNVNNRIYIRVDSINPQAGSLAAAPGEIDATTGQTVEPYGWNYTRASIATPSGSIRVPHGVSVKDNICKRTLPAVAAYSDWGFGEAYTKNGYVDHAVPDVLLRGVGCRIQLPMRDLYVEQNHFEAGRYGLEFAAATGYTLDDRALVNAKIRFNTIKDCDNAGVQWPGASSATHQDVVFEGNEIDCDPHFTTSNRGPASGAKDGTWLASGVPIAFNVPFLAGASFRRNTFRNVCQTIVNTSASTLQNIEGNYLVADPSVIGSFSTLNKGIGAIPDVGDGLRFWLLAEDCDPSSANYGQCIGANPRSAAAMPTTGKWMARTFVSNHSRTVSSNRIVLGWLRLTTGTGHVDGTDWIACYSDTV